MPINSAANLIINRIKLSVFTSFDSGGNFVDREAVAFTVDPSKGNRRDRDHSGASRLACGFMQHRAARLAQTVA